MRLDLISLLESSAEGIAERFAKGPFLEKDIFTESGIYAARKMLVISLVAALAIEKNGQVSDAIRHIITLPINYPFLASERLVPAFLSVFWAKEKLSSDRNNELELGGVLGSLLHCAKYSPLPSSYYRLEEVAAWRYKSYLGRHWHDIDGDNAKRRSQFSRALHALLAKRNWKQTCKIQWPDITRTSETFTRLHRPEEIGFAKSAAATEEDRFVNIPQTWEGLLSDILSTAKPRLPKLLEDDYVALLLLCIFLPYRATYELILYLDKKFGICWYR